MILRLVSPIVLISTPKTTGWLLLLLLPRHNHSRSGISAIWTSFSAYFVSSSCIYGLARMRRSVGVLILSRNYWWSVCVRVLLIIIGSLATPTILTGRIWPKTVPSWNTASKSVMLIEKGRMGVGHWLRQLDRGFVVAGRSGLRVGVGASAQGLLHFTLGLACPFRFSSQHFKLPLEVLILNS